MKTVFEIKKKFFKQITNNEKAKSFYIEKKTTKHNRKY